MVMYFVKERIEVDEGDIPNVGGAFSVKAHLVYQGDDREKALEATESISGEMAVYNHDPKMGTIFIHRIEYVDGEAGGVIAGTLSDEDPLLELERKRDGPVNSGFVPHVDEEFEYLDSLKRQVETEAGVV